MNFEISELRPKFPGTGRPVFLAAAVLLLALAALTGPARADDAKAREIMQKVNDRNDGDNQSTDMEMILIDKRGNKRERSIRSFRKDKGKDTYTIMFFLTPADVKNTGFLTYDYKAESRDDDQWLYLPALQKTKRIASDDKSGSFMGSDFNYSDMTERTLEDYEFTLMQEAEVEGVKTWQIQSVPRSDKIADETGYSKSIVWVRQDNYMVIRAVSWVHKSRRLKYFQAKALEQIDGIWVARELSMTTREGQETTHSTLLRFRDIKFNQDLPESLFTERQLQKGP